MTKCIIYRIKNLFNLKDKAESFTKNMGRGEGTSRELPEGWIDFEPNSVTYNLAKHVCSL